MKKLSLMLILILSVGIVAASADNYVFKEKISDAKYYPRENRVITTVTYIDYENENRHPTSDYRYGYTYRATKEYRDSYKVNRDNIRTYSWDYSDHFYDKEIAYYDYVPHLRGYVEKTCYTSAPSDKLFYIKC